MLRRSPVRAVSSQASEIPAIRPNCGAQRPQTEPARSTTRKQPTVAGSEELRRKILEILEMFREKWRF